MRNPYLVLALALMASGCGEARGNEHRTGVPIPGTDARVYEVETEHGVLCVVVDGYSANGIACDFPPEAIEVAHTDSGEAGE